MIKIHRLRGVATKEQVTPKKIPLARIALQPGIDLGAALDASPAEVEAFYKTMPKQKDFYDSIKAKGSVTKKRKSNINLLSISPLRSTRLEGIETMRFNQNQSQHHTPLQSKKLPGNEDPFTLLERDIDMAETAAFEDIFPKLENGAAATSWKQCMQTEFNFKFSAIDVPTRTSPGFLPAANTIRSNNSKEADDLNNHNTSD